jgi:hypothetical protein
MARKPIDFSRKLAKTKKGGESKKAGRTDFAFGANVARKGRRGGRGGGS